MCIQDYRIRSRCHVNKIPVIATVAGSFQFPPNPRRVGISYSPVADNASIYDSDGSNTGATLLKSSATNPVARLWLDFIRDGPIVQGAFVIVDGDAVGGEIAYETVADQDVSKLIQGEI